MAQVSAPFKVKANTEGIGWCEFPRGGTYAVHIDEDKNIKACKNKIGIIFWQTESLSPYRTSSAIMDFIINEAEAIKYS